MEVGSTLHNSVLSLHCCSREEEERVAWQSQVCSLTISGFVLCNANSLVHHTIITGLMPDLSGRSVELTLHFSVYYKRINAH